MNLLKRDSFWGWGILFGLFTPVVPVLLLGNLLGCTTKKWYLKWEVWIGLTIFFVVFLTCAALFTQMGVLLLGIGTLPLLVAITTSFLQIFVDVSKKLSVPFEQIYGSILCWVLIFLVPVVGWFFLPIIFIYLSVMIVIQLYKGSGERYLTERGGFNEA